MPYNPIIRLKRHYRRRETFARSKGLRISRAVLRSSVRRFRSRNMAGKENGLYSMSRMYLMPTPGTQGTDGIWGQEIAVPPIALPIAGDIAGYIYARPNAQALCIGFRLSDNPDRSDLAALWDQYKLNYAEFIMENCYAAQTADTNGTGFLDPLTNKRFRVVKDYDDQITLPTTEDGFLTYGNVQSFPCLSKKVVLRVKPKYCQMTQINDNGVLQYPTAVGSKWVDTAYAGTPIGMGLKLYIPSFAEVFQEGDLEKIPLFKCYVKLHFFVKNKN